MKSAVDEGKPPIEGCGNDEVMAQMDFLPGTSKGSALDPPKNSSCVFPQIEYLEEIHREVPNATFLLNTRNRTKWVASVKNWHGAMDERMSGCHVGPKSNSVSDLIDWYDAHQKRVYDFVAKNPSHKLVVVDIEDPTSGEMMASKFIHTNATHWGRSNKLKHTTRK